MKPIKLVITITKGDALFAEGTFEEYETLDKPFHKVASDLRTFGNLVEALAESNGE